MTKRAAVARSALVLPALVRAATVLADTSVQGDAPDPEQPRRLLEEVLARPEFRPHDAYVPAWLSRFLDWLFGGLGAAPAWLGAVVTALILVGAAAFVISLFVGGGVGRRRRSARRPTVTAAAEASAPTGRGDLIRAGESARAAGDFSRAVVLLFRAVVAGLVSRGLLLEDGSRTNREHLRDLRPRESEAAAFAEALPCFERVYYGAAMATAEDADLLSRTVRGVAS